jgi:thymidylate kinase
MLKGEQLFEEARRCYASLSQPSLVCLLDVAPEEAAKRKDRYGYSETGNFDGLSGITRENFVAYQTRVRKALSSLAQDGAWIKVDATHGTADHIAEHLVDSVKGVLLP